MLLQCKKCSILKGNFFLLIRADSQPLKIDKIDKKTLYLRKKGKKKSSREIYFFNRIPLTPGVHLSQLLPQYLGEDS